MRREEQKRREESEGNKVQMIEISMGKRGRREISKCRSEDGMLLDASLWKPWCSSYDRLRLLTWASGMTWMWLMNTIGIWISKVSPFAQSTI